MLKEQVKAAAIQAKAKASAVSGQRPKAPSNMEGNTKKAKEAKEASKKVGMFTLKWTLCGNRRPGESKFRENKFMSLFAQ